MTSLPRVRPMTPLPLSAYATLSADTVGVWFVSMGDADWLAAINREGEEIVLAYRFRYYAEPNDARDPWDGRDRKSGYELRGPASDLPKLLDTTREVAANLASCHNTQPIELLASDYYDANAFIAAFLAQPFIHAREKGE